MEKEKIEKIADVSYTLAKFEFDMQDTNRKFMHQKMKFYFDILIDDTKTALNNLFKVLKGPELDTLKAVFMSRSIALLRNCKEWCFVGNPKKLDAYKNDAMIYLNLLNHVKDFIGTNSKNLENS